jgi:hypothetical protein
MKNVFILMVGLALLFSAVVVIAQDKPESEPKDSTRTVTAGSKERLSKPVSSNS